MHRLGHIRRKYLEARVFMQFFLRQQKLSVEKAAGTHSPGNVGTKAVNSAFLFES